jgi:triphosphoribosyl-dephospho-CoA synthetase
LASPGNDEQPVQPRALSSSPRERLRQLVASRVTAERQLAEAGATRQRVRDLIVAADEAERIAADLEQAVSTATREWAENGADPIVPSVPQALLDKRTAARRLADEAHFKAQGAEAALPKITADERDARQTLTSTDEAIKAAAMDVLIAEAAPSFKRLDRAARQYRQALAELLPLAVLARPLWGHAHRYGGFAGGSAGDAIAQAFESARVGIPSDDKLRHEADKLVDLSRADELIRYARALCADPDAKQ